MNARVRLLAVFALILVPIATMPTAGSIAAEPTPTPTAPAGRGNGHRTPPTGNHEPACPHEPRPGYFRCHAQAVVTSPGTLFAASLPYGYGPAQFRTGYGLTGSGPGNPIVAIVDAYDHPSIQSDLDIYSDTFGIPRLPACTVQISTSTTPCFQKMNQSGGTQFPAVNSGWALEIALDVEVTHAVCQNCRILLVEATTNSYSDILTAVDRAILSGAAVVSNSYGSGEFSSQTSLDSHFNHPGIPITVSSGDSGYGVEWPAASQYVTAVGGTTLRLNSDDTYQSEAAWSGAGSGCSHYEPKPAWQHDSACSNRTVADVSADADPASPAAVYDSVQTQGQSGWFAVGGTSLASPLVAAVYALGGGVGSGTQANSVPYNNNPATNLHDVTTGSNGSCGNYLCTAGAGYDGPTGLGAPKGTAAFQQSGTATPTATATATPTATATATPTATATATTAPTATATSTATATATTAPTATATPTVTATTTPPPTATATSTATATATALPAAPACTSGSPPTGQFCAEYFNNRTLTAPVATAVLEPTVDHDWGGGGPGNGVGTDNFSARFSGSFSFQAGNYTFSSRSDDGVRVYLDNALILDNWFDQNGATTYTATASPGAGAHTVKVEYYENGGGALVHVSWAAAPAAACSGASPPTGQFCAEYFNNRTLTAPVAFAALENSVDHDWGGGGPGNGVGTDAFSARYTGNFTFQAGTYTFSSRSDDGVRVYLDNVLILDQWFDQNGATTYTATVSPGAGSHTVKVEYYENTGGALVHVSWAQAASCSGASPPSGQFCAEYFGNRTLTAPVAVAAIENTIDHDWGGGGPASLPTDNFSARWTGSFNLQAGNYTFSARSDDGVRVYLDSSLIIDQWFDQGGGTTYTTTLAPGAGAHTVKVEYYENGGGALVHVSWAAAPAAACTGTSPPTGQFCAEYFNNRTLSGSPVVAALEPTVDHDWGGGGPAGLPIDNFSARWTGAFSFQAGSYTFSSRSDDGVRVYLDNTLILDKWFDQNGATTYTATLTPGAGSHTIKVEYYENGGGAMVHVSWGP